MNCMLTKVMNGKPGWKLLRFGSKVHFIASARLSFTTTEFTTVVPVDGSLTFATTSISFSYNIVLEFNNVDFENSPAICYENKQKN